MKDKIKMIIFVLVLGAVWASALVAVDRVTRDRIEAYNREKVRKSILTALGIEYEGKSIDELFKSGITEEKIADGKKGEKSIYRTTDGAVAFEVTSSGSQGPIRAVVALEEDLDTIRGINIVDNTETPGLGDRVLADKNMVKFKGKKLKPKFLVVREGEAKGDNQVDAITGATLTSKAVEKLLNKAVAEQIPLLDKGGQE
jgi:Na+-transporting NADH:ubiquinone oxidoreductase subunit C